MSHLEMFSCNVSKNWFWKLTWKDTLATTLTKMSSIKLLTLGIKKRKFMWTVQAQLEYNLWILARLVLMKLLELHESRTYIARGVKTSDSCIRIKPLSLSAFICRAPARKLASSRSLACVPLFQIDSLLFVDSIKAFHASLLLIPRFCRYIAAVFWVSFFS